MKSSAGDPMVKTLTGTESASSYASSSMGCSTSIGEGDLSHGGEATLWWWGVGVVGDES